MSTFFIPTDENLPAEALTVFQEVTDAFQSVPIFYRILAAAPPLLITYWHSYQNVVAVGMLPQQIKELIFLAVARKRHCAYCASTHLAICDIYDINRSTIESVIQQMNDIQPKRLAVLLEFCLNSMDNPEQISEQDYQKLYSHGITQQEVLEALYTVAYSNSGIFLAKALKVEVEQDIKDYLEDKNLSIGFI